MNLAMKKLTVFLEENLVCSMGEMFLLQMRPLCRPDHLFDLYVYLFKETKFPQQNAYG